jgi:hypothetical protein
MKDFLETYKNRTEFTSVANNPFLDAIKVEMDRNNEYSIVLQGSIELQGNDYEMVRLRNAFGDMKADESTKNIAEALEDYFLLHYGFSFKKGSLRDVIGDSIFERYSEGMEQRKERVLKHIQDNTDMFTDVVVAGSVYGKDYTVPTLRQFTDMRTLDNVEDRYNDGDKEDFNRPPRYVKVTEKIGGRNIDVIKKRVDLPDGKIRYVYMQNKSTMKAKTMPYDDTMHYETRKVSVLKTRTLEEYKDFKNGKVKMVYRYGHGLKEGDNVILNGEPSVVEDVSNNVVTIKTITDEVERFKDFDELAHFLHLENSKYMQMSIADAKTNNEIKGKVAQLLKGYKNVDESKKLITIIPLISYLYFRRVFDRD